MPPHRARRARAGLVVAAVGAVAAVVVVWGLARGDDSNDAEGGLAVVTTTTAPPDTAAPPAETSVPPTVLAGVVGDLPGIRLELNALERQSDEVVRLAFTLINTNATPFTFGENFGTTGSVSGIHILDTANEQTLATLTDEGGVCRCSHGLGQLAPGARMSLYAELAAPPADIGLVSVVVPHFPGVQKIRMT